MQICTQFWTVATVLLLSLPSLLQAWVLNLYLPAVPSLPQYNPSLLPSSTTATLFKYGTTLTAPVTRRNTFEYSNVEAGSYLLTLACRDYTFPPLRIDVNTSSISSDGTSEARVEAWQTFWGNEWGNKGEYRGGGAVERTDNEVQPLADPNKVNVEVRPVAKKEFYMDRNTFSALSFLKSPMILMGLFSLVMIVGLPYLMENMDEESKQELEDMQKKGIMGNAGGAADTPNTAQSIQNFDLASWMAGKTSGSKGNEKK